MRINLFHRHEVSNEKMADQCECGEAGETIEVVDNECGVVATGNGLVGRKV